MIYSKVLNRTVVLDPARIVATSRIDIYSGESETLDVAVRFDGDPTGYGWNNETYLHSGWKNPDWQLPPGRYLVKVSVTSSGETWTEVFRLVNDVVNRSDVRLEPATLRDRRREGLVLR